VRNRINLQRLRPLFSALALAGAAGPAAAQRLLDLPMRAGAGADALAAGAIAVFWNPGSLGIPAGRGEALAIDVRGPSSTSLDGIGLAAVVRLDPQTAVAAGVQRVSVDEIEATSTSPLPGEGTAPIDLAENAFSFAALRSIGPTMSVGVNVLYARASDYVGGSGDVAIGTGFRWTPAWKFSPALAAGVRHDEQGTDWFAGAAVSRALGRDSVWTARAEYGVRGSARFRGMSHRTALFASWRDRFGVSAGVAAEPGADGHTFKPVMGVGLRLSRYQLSVLREDLPNGVGAVHSFRLGVSF